MGLFDYYKSLGQQTTQNIIPQPTTSTGQPYVSSPASAPASQPAGPAPVAAAQSGGPPRSPEWWAHYSGMENLITRTPTGYDTRLADRALFQQGLQMQMEASPRLQALAVANRALGERQAAVTAHAQAVRSGDWSLIEQSRVRYLEAEAAHNVAMSAFGGASFLATPTEQMRDYNVRPGPVPAYVGSPITRSAQTLSSDTATYFSPTGWLGGINRQVSGMITGRVPWLLPAVERYGSPAYRVATAPLFAAQDAGVMVASAISGANRPLPSQMFGEAFKGYVKYPIESPVSAVGMMAVGGLIGGAVRGATAAAGTARGAAFVARHPTAVSLGTKAFTYGLGGIAAIGAGTQILAPVPAGIKEQTFTKQLSSREIQITTVKTPQYRMPSALEMSQRTGRVLGEFTFGLAGAYGGYHIPEATRAFRNLGESGLLLPPKKQIRTIDLTRQLDVSKTTPKTIPVSPTQASAEMSASRLHLRVRSARTGGFKPYYFEMQEINANIRAGMAMFPETAIASPAPAAVKVATITTPWRVTPIPSVITRIEPIQVSARKLAYPFVITQKGYPFQTPKAITTPTETQRRHIVPVPITGLNRITKITQDRRSVIVPRIAQIPQPKITQERKSTVVPRLDRIQAPQITQETITTTVPDMARITQRVPGMLPPTVPAIKVFMPAFPPFPAGPRGGGGGKPRKGKKKKSWTITNPVPHLKGFKIKLPKW